ncbi:ABC transporter permease [Natronosporangium hydrolyticum]|uniref:ABC transporter permease n=2 Tax=Natronosporangium hydrolyticum TaxID=2811111 RepID=A0A895YIA3_9ACTN|nr:ABC transporter permease [Natronosporangium hydrolyticum]
MPAGAAVAAVVLGGLVLAAVIGPWARPTGVNLGNVFAGPSLSHPMGTDASGRDLLAMVLAAMRVSFTISVLAAAVAVSIGVTIGAVAGLFGRWVDGLAMRVVDFMASQNHFLFAILLVVLFRPVLGAQGAVLLSVGLTHWTTVARIVRGELLSLRARPFVTAAVGGGADRWRLARRHFLPHLTPSIITAMILLVPHAIFHESGLSFLGLGLPAHQASLGNMLADSQQAIYAGAWWTALFPGLVIFAMAASVGTFGEWLRDRYQPQWRSELRL